MKRIFFYGGSVFLFLCMLSAAYYGTYCMTARRDAPEQIMEPVSGEAWTDARAVSGKDPKDTTLDSAGYYLKEKDGFVIVYLPDRKTVFETTAISSELLPDKVKAEVQKGKYIRSQEELYGFLENYSS